MPLNPELPALPVGATDHPFLHPPETQHDAHPPPQSPTGTRPAQVNQTCTHHEAAATGAVAAIPPTRSRQFVLEQRAISVNVWPDGVLQRERVAALVGVQKRPDFRPAPPEKVDVVA